MKILERISKASNDNNSKLSLLIKKIALISISIGIFFVLISSFILNGFKDEIKKKIFSFSGHYDLSSYSNGLSFKNSPLDLTKGLFINYKNIEDIESIQPYVLNSALIQGENTTIDGVIFKGIEENYIENIYSQVDEFEKNLPFSSSIIISSAISSRLNINLNDTVVVLFPNNPPVFRKLYVKGIFSTGLEEIDNSIVFGDIKLSRKIYGWDESTASGIHILASNYSDPLLLEKIKSETSYDEYVESTESKYIQIFDWLRLLDKNVIILFIIIALVACFNMISTVFIIIMERTKFIGVLKSFGTKKKIIYSIFFKSAFITSMKGILLGNTFSLIFYFIQKKFQIFTLDRKSYYLDFVPLQLDIESIFIINFLLLTMIIISIYLPIIFIDKVKIINSLKFN